MEEWKIPLHFLAWLSSIVIILLCISEMYLAPGDILMLLLAVGYVAWRVYAFGKSKGEYLAMLRQFTTDIKATRERIQTIEREQKQDQEKKQLSEKRYTDEELNAVKHYIANTFGPVTQMFYDGDQNGTCIDIAVTEPGLKHGFYTLTTVGMGAHRMNVQEILQERNQAFAELVICLPPDWDLMRDSWPFHMLKETARFPFAAARRNGLGIGSRYHGTMMTDSGFYGVLVAPIPASVCKTPLLMLPDGRIVNFYLLLPLFEEEWKYIATDDDFFEFLHRYMKCGNSIVIDPNRASCVSEDETDEDEAWNT